MWLIYMEFNLQSSDFLITISIDNYSDNLYTMLGYPAQTGDSDEEASPKGAIKPRQKYQTKKANDGQDDIDDDGKYIYEYDIIRGR